MATVKLPMWTNPETITKVVMSASPAAADVGGGGGGITVAAIARADPRFVARLGKIFVCHLPGRKKKKHHPDDDDNAWSDISRVFYVQDIVFLEGKLYAVTEAEEISAFDDADIEHYSHLPSDQWRWTHVGKQAPAFGRTEFYLVACHTMGKVLVVSRDFGRARVPDTGGGRAAARYHTSRFKVYVVEEHDQLETWGSWRKKTRLTRIPRLRGHALFIGDASCQAFDVTSSGAGGKIAENQIWYVDDERNMVVTVAAGDGPVISSSWALRSVQSYDMRTSCFRRYQRKPHKPSSPWECVMLQRYLGVEAMVPPPVTEFGATLLLWEVINGMGATKEPTYYYSASRRRRRTTSTTTTEADDDGAADYHAVTVSVNVLNRDCLRFTQVGASVQEAKQMVAWEAVTFLRSRFRSVLDDSPWSSIPHYHSHASEIEYDKDFDDDFDYADL
uniref:KIB1-4 beta-propeller domain-containing protein n=1 Tax=Oryza glumipatula TaxID=40148 RepID=A0A0D9ZR32_9ORYZ